MKRQDLVAPNVYNIVDEFEKHAVGDKKALIIQHEDGQREEITYVELIARANQVANVFYANGLQKGDVILVMLPRSVEAYLTYIGALKAGLIIIPSSELLRAKDIDYRIEHAEVKAIVANENYIAELDEVQHLNGLVLFVAGEAEKPWISFVNEINAASTQFDAPTTLATDMAFLAYTSGTTGNPKGAVHPHSWGYAHLRTTANNWLGVHDGDIVWATAAPGWQKWIWSPLLATLGSGATAFVYTGKFDTVKYLTLLQNIGVNVLCCTPTEYRMMAKAENLSSYNLEKLRSAVSAGEPLNREVIETFKREFNVQVRDGYGQTENTLLVGTLFGMESRPGSMGKPTPGNVVEIIDEYGEIVDVGVVGDIAVHNSTPALFKGYYKDVERTQMQFRGDWFITGDQAYKDEDGYFWFQGRNDDIIISSGYTIGPFEVEDALVKHPAIRECAVVASPDAVRGSIVKAFVVLCDENMKNSPTIVTELQEHVKALTAPYKYPRAIEFLDELPKTASGKIRRVALRKSEQNKSLE
ncbi:acyl-CoA synthetase MbcS [Metasolibacillus meyeri]|uniref:acyl-CoA synthetase MbcS n=1 Tax=Metasolibacillus meyeri TaxID=1071052 RepID=UPI000D326C34|nr:acyl--CoA ligase [Metasolibacillus meyeri]